MNTGTHEPDLCNYVTPRRDPRKKPKRVSARQWKRAQKSMRRLAKAYAS